MKEKIKTELEKNLCCPKCRGEISVSPAGYTCPAHGEWKKSVSGCPLLIDGAVFTENSEEHETGVNWLKSLLKRVPLLYYGVWHLVCPVLMIQNGPRKIRKYIPKDTFVYDIGSGPERLGEEFINVDVYPFPEVDVVSDACSLPFKDGVISAIVTESMLEHVRNPVLAAKEIERVVKRGGFVYASAPFIHPYHASPDDFGRWSLSGLKELFSGLEIVEAGVRSGPWSAFLMFIAYWLGNVFSFGSRRMSPFLAHVFMIPLGWLKYLDLIFANIPGSEAVAAHLYIIGRKK